MSNKCIVMFFSLSDFWPKSKLLEEEDDNSCDDDNSINNIASTNVYIKKNEDLQTLWLADRVYLFTSDNKLILIYLAILEKLLNYSF
jgi:hypothetical protein